MAEAEAAAVLKVFILITEHHNGRNVYPCSSYERAWARLDQYVQEFWNSSGGHPAQFRRPLAIRRPYRRNSGSRCSTTTGSPSGWSRGRSRNTRCCHS